MTLDLQGILDALLEGVVVLDDAGRVEFSNTEARRLLDAAAFETSAGKQLTDTLGPDHPLARIVERVRLSGRPAIHDEVDFPRPLATPIPVDVSVSLLGDDPPRPGAARPLAVAIRDRSAARSLREEIRERERQESYGQIAAGIAHEVKNPLGGIRGAAELLSLRAQDDRAKKAAQLIVGEVDRISSLLELERGYEEIRVERVYDPSLPELKADPARLQQIFLNLARNAMQSMEKTGGTLTLSTGMTLEHRLVGPDGRPRPTIEVCVSDTGPGISPDVLDRLSTPFYTTKEHGTGLGLSVARHWIRRHGGRLRLDSVEGEGTHAAVDLPLAPLLPPSDPALQEPRS